MIRRASTLATLAVGTVICWAQVRIVSFDRNGRLVWTNSANLERSPYYSDPVYAVDVASSPAGPWSTFTNTSQTSTSVTNMRAHAFCRVAWTNGQVWSYKGYDGQNLVVTGKVYLAVSHLDDPSVPYVYGGSWDLARTAAQGGKGHRVGVGSLKPVPDGSWTLWFYPYCCDNDFWLDGSTPTSNTWTGVWYWQGFVDDASGPFLAERILSGD